MKVIQAPNRVDWEAPITIFLAGSIEMGVAEDWQNEAIDLFKKLLPKGLQSKVQILNPRRDDWDSTWERTYEDPQFSQQVRWELKSLQESDYILMYFDPGTKSPITLLELGLFVGKNLIVVCPEGYWRKGNVDIVCETYEIVQKKTLKQAVQHIIKQESW